MEIIIRIFFDIPHPFGPWSQLQSNLKVHDNCESLFICFFIFFICLARLYVQKDRQLFETFFEKELFETLNDIFEIEEIKITYKIFNFCQESSQHENRLYHFYFFLNYKTDLNYYTFLNIQNFIFIFWIFQQKYTKLTWICFYEGKGFFFFFLSSVKY